MEHDIEKLKKQFPLSKCKKILNKGGNNYSDENIIAIRDYLFHLAEINYRVLVHSETKDREREEDLEKRKAEGFEQ